MHLDNAGVNFKGGVKIKKLLNFILQNVGLLVESTVFVVNDKVCILVGPEQVRPVTMCGCEPGTQGSIIISTHSQNKKNQKCTANSPAYRE